MIIDNEYGREFDASPQYIWINATTIAASATRAVDWESYNSDSKRFLPFNFTRLVNNSSVDIWFYPNQDTNKGLFIPKGTILSMDKNALPALSSFSIKNNDGSTATGTNNIIMTCSREAQTADSVVARLHKRLFDRSKKGWII
jgi:hypothetical protein